jgi:DNA-binding NtrC family response regulator
VLRALVADDDGTVRRAVHRALAPLALDVTESENGQQAIARLGCERFDVVVSDLAMPLADGFAVLQAARTEQPRTPVVILTGSGTMPECVRAMRAGAFDFVCKPFRVAVLQAAVQAALKARSDLRSETGKDQRTIKNAHSQPDLWLGNAPAAGLLKEMIERVAATNATVLITGETGTGKELVASSLHRLSPRADGPLVVVNCGSIPEGLIESELFGHVKGAFTGATGPRLGRMREADGGTLFLDEIGELPLPLQTRLLRVVQEREVTPIGGDTAHLVTARFVAATNRDLEAMVAQGRFRQDLFFRLNVVPLTVPPLRERRDDIPLLANHFLGRAAVKTAGAPLTISAEAMAALQEYAWPGNVRQLENLIQRAAILDRDGTIDVNDLPEGFRTDLSAMASQVVDEAAGARIDLGQAVAQFEWTIIQKTLRATAGNQSKAAALLGIARTTLIDKIKRQR